MRQTRATSPPSAVYSLSVDDHTVGFPPATTEFVVPRSISTAFAMMKPPIEFVATSIPVSTDEQVSRIRLRFDTRYTLGACATASTMRRYLRAAADFAYALKAHARFPREHLPAVGVAHHDSHGDSGRRDDFHDDVVHHFCPAGGAFHDRHGFSGCACLHLYRQRDWLLFDGTARELSDCRRARHGAQLFLRIHGCGDDALHVAGRPRRGVYLGGCFSSDVVLGSS